MNLRHQRLVFVYLEVLLRVISGYREAERLVWLYLYPFASFRMGNGSNSPVSIEA